MGMLHLVLPMKPPRAAGGSPRRGRNQHPLTERRRVVHGLHQQLTSYGSSYGQIRRHRGGPAFFDVTALIFFFGVELNASLHSMVIIM
jgi:hypothetical protein